jgi:hypothetical protein
VARKSAREAAEPPAATEYQAALEKLGQMYMEFAASPEGVRFLEAQHAELIGPRHEGEYVNAALARDKEREVAANPHDKTRSADYAQKRSPKHEFGREARTLTNRPKRR